MMLVEETTVSLSALPVADLKEQLRLGSGFTDDGLQDGILTTCLRASMAAIEARTGKILIEREFSWTLRAWRGTVEQGLPVAPVSAMSDVVLTDAGGTQTDVTAACLLVADLQRPRISALGTLLPVIPQHGSVKIGFMAGYGPDWSDIPADLAQAVLMLAAYFYDFRHGEANGRDMMPPAVTMLVDRYRTVRIGGGL